MRFFFRKFCQIYLRQGKGKSINGASENTNTGAEKAFKPQFISVKCGFESCSPTKRRDFSEMLRIILF